MKTVIILFINIYQKTISPDHSCFGRLFFPFGVCRYKKSCSQYCKESVKKHGVLKGLFWGVRRVLSCNPFSKGIDEAAS